MDFDHCDSYESFLESMVFDDIKLKELYETASKSVEPLAQNVSHKEEELQDQMDDCWDTEWINPHLGIPHYHVANLPNMYMFM